MCLFVFLYFFICLCATTEWIEHWTLTEKNRANSKIIAEETSESEKRMIMMKMNRTPNGKENAQRKYILRAGKIEKRVIENTVIVTKPSPAVITIASSSCYSLCLSSFVFGPVLFFSFLLSFLLKTLKRQWSSLCWIPFFSVCWARLPRMAFTRSHQMYFYINFLFMMIIIFIFIYLHLRFHLFRFLLL